MFRFTSTLVISLVLLFFFDGCSSKQAEPSENGMNEIAKTEPVKGENESVDVEQTAIEPNEATAVTIEPNDSTSNVEEPNQPEPETVTTELDQTEPNDATPDAIEPNEPEQQDDQNIVDINDVDPNMPAVVPVEQNEPDEADANAVDQGVADINNVANAVIEPNQADTNDTVSPQIEPNEPNETTTQDANNIAQIPVEPKQADVNEVKPVKVEPNDIDQQPKVTFHDKYAEIFKLYVTKDGLVDYETLRRKQPDLLAVLKQFDKLSPDEYNAWPREDKIAFLINAYNLQMIYIITHNYPIKPSVWLRPIFGPKSIRYIDGIWTTYKFMVMDEVFTLEQIEKKYFRDEFEDPRIFLALSRGSMSGPPLRQEPYYGYKLDKQLDDQARRFLANPLAFRIDRSKGYVHLSALFQKTKSLYGSEFLKKYATDLKFKEQVPEIRAVLNFITNYVSESTVSFLETGNYTVQFIAYDWNVNDAP